MATVDAAPVGASEQSERTDENLATASHLAIAADEYWALRAAATKVIARWGDLVELLHSAMRNPHARETWQRFAGALVELRVAMVELGEHVRA